MRFAVRFTPLMAAANAGHVVTIQKLLAAGASAEAVDSTGRLALGYAISQGKKGAVAILLDQSHMLPAAARGGDDLEGRSVSVIAIGVFRQRCKTLYLLTGRDDARDRAADAPAGDSPHDRHRHGAA